MIVLVSIIAAAIPAALYTAVIYWFDRYEKEPAWLLTATFLWGAIPSIILALIFNLLGSLPFYIYGDEALADAAGTIIIAPLVEETVKGLAVLAVVLIHRHEIDSLLDGIIYGAMVGMGFAMVENVFYFVAVYGEEGIEAFTILVVLRGVVFGLNHSLFTAMTGLGLAIARFSRQKPIVFIAPVAGWTAAVFLHFVHNLASSFPGWLCLVLPFTDWGGVWLLMLIIIWALVQEKRWIRDYLAEEVAWGTLTLSQYEQAQSGRKRTLHHWNTLLNHGFRPYLRLRHFYHLCSELAYKKHHYALLQEQRSQDLTQSLRSHITDLSRQI